MQQAAHDSGNEVENHKAANTHKPLQDRPREPKPSHVQQQVHAARVDKLICEYLPKVPIRYPAPIQPEKIIHPSSIFPTKKGLENENENINRNQNVDCGELDFLLSKDHRLNLATARTFVHTPVSGARSSLSQRLPALVA